jgi:hypothetical protein
MIVCPLIRSVRLKAATASSRVALLPMFVHTRPSRTRRTISTLHGRRQSIDGQRMPAKWSEAVTAWLRCWLTTRSAKFGDVLMALVMRWVAWARSVNAGAVARAAVARSVGESRGRR